MEVDQDISLGCFWIWQVPAISVTESIHTEVHPKAGASSAWWHGGQPGQQNIIRDHHIHVSQTNVGIRQ